MQLSAGNRVPYARRQGLDLWVVEPHVATRQVLVMPIIFGSLRGLISRYAKRRKAVNNGMNMWAAKFKIVKK